MPSLRDHERNVLAAVLPERRDLFDKLNTHLTPEHFTSDDLVLRNLFVFMRFFYERTHSVLKRSHLEQIISRDVTPSNIKARAAAFLEEYDLLVEKDVSEADFHWSVDELKDSVAERATLEAITEAMVIAKHGAVSTTGEEIKGHKAARISLVERITAIDRQLNREDSPEGDVRNEGTAFLAEYDRQKQMRELGITSGIRSGVSAIDDVVDGLQPGELDLMIGNSSSGKSSFCVQLAHNACVEQGKNVAFYTSETLRPQISRKLLARHSNLDKFGLRQGLNTRDIKNGTLTEEEEKILRDVVRDWSSNPDYGRFHLAQVPHGATVNSIYASAQAVHHRFSVDLIVIDYLKLMSSGTRRQSSREEYNDTLVQAKQMATAFADGRGVPVVSPWQVTREAHEKAVVAGYYTLSALAETSEATNSPDVIISFLEPREKQGRYTELKAQVLKDRDGEQASGLQVNVDYASCYFSSGDAGRSLNVSSLFGI